MSGITLEDKIHPFRFSSIEANLKRLFDVPVGASVVNIPARSPELFESERPLMATAGPKRASEFGTGRWCARQALVEIGLSHCAIPSLPDRRPQWPDGTTGSISHSAEICCAVAAREADALGLGIDVEPRGAVKPELVSLIVADGEHVPDIHLPDIRSIVFGGKESFYKAYYPITNNYLDFKDVGINISGSKNEGTFVIYPIKCFRNDNYIFDIMRGFWTIQDTNIFCGATIRI